MIAVGIDKADTFISKLQKKGINVKWDGWDMVFLTKTPTAEYDVLAVRQNNEWGIPTTVSPNIDGKWLIDYKMTLGRPIVPRR